MLNPKFTRLILPTSIQIAHKASLTHYNDAGLTPLHSAATAGKAEFLNILGAPYVRAFVAARDASRKNNENLNFSALHEKVKAAHPEAVLDLNILTGANFI